MLSAVPWHPDSSLLLLPAGHFMQRGDSGQGPHAQICGCHQVEIQGENCHFVKIGLFDFLNLLQRATTFLCIFPTKSLEITTQSQDYSGIISTRAGVAGGLR